VHDERDRQERDRADDGGKCARGEADDRPTRHVGIGERVEQRVKAERVNVEERGRVLHEDVLSQRAFQQRENRCTDRDQRVAGDECEGRPAKAAQPQFTRLHPFAGEGAVVAPFQ
jgi:hypothetical protein